LISGLIDFFLTSAKEYGLLGVGLGMFAESVGIPFGGMVFIIGSTYLLGETEVAKISLVMVATLSSTLGSIVSYYMGFIGGNYIRKRHHGHLVKQEKRFNRFVDKYGEFAIFVAQLFGAARTFVSLPAGLIRMDLKKFIIGTFTGTLLFCTIIVYLSAYLKDILEDISQYLGIPIWLSLVLAFIFFFLIFRAYKNQLDENCKDCQD
jgi:membrane protein DedA with SNARE-associated domain